MVLHLPQAQALVDTQLGVLHSKAVTHERVMERVKLLFHIQEIAREAYTQKSGLPYYSPGDHFSRTAYIRAFYHLFNLFTKSAYTRQEKVIGLPLCVLKLLSVLELQQILAVIDMFFDTDSSAWIRGAEIMPSKAMSFGIEDESVWSRGAEIMPSKDQCLQTTMQSLGTIGNGIDDLLVHLETLSGLLIVEASAEQRLGVEIWHSYPDVTDYTQAPLLADLLPRIADKIRGPFSRYKLV